MGFVAQIRIQQHITLGVDIDGISESAVKSSVIRIVNVVLYRDFRQFDTAFPGPSFIQNRIGQNLPVFIYRYLIRLIVVVFQRLWICRRMELIKADSQRAVPFVGTVGIKLGQHIGKFR